MSRADLQSAAVSGTDQPERRWGMNSATTVFSLLALLGCGTLWSAAYANPCGVAGPPSAQAAAGLDHEQVEREHDRVRGLALRGDILPLRRVLESARRHHPGRVLDTELEKHCDGYVYEVQLVDNRGRVWEMILDAASGELLEDRWED
jgi:hypothetical protein